MEVQQAADKPRPVTTFEMPKEEEIEERPLRVPSFLADVLGVSALVFACWFFFFYGVSGGRLWLALGWASLPTLLVIIWRAWSVFDRPVSYYRHTWWQKVWVPVEETIEPDARLVIIPGPEGTTVEFWQPRPGEFASWAAAVLSETNKTRPANQRTTLSQNTGQARGWSISQYRAMINALDDAGWVGADGQYVMFSVTGEQYVWPWLENRERISK